MESESKAVITKVAPRQDAPRCWHWLFVIGHKLTLVSVSLTTSYLGSNRSTGAGAIYPREGRRPVPRIHGTLDTEQVSGLHFRSHHGFQCPPGREDRSDGRTKKPFGSGRNRIGRIAWW